MTDPSPQSQIAKLADAVIAARRALNDGDDVDLAGLDGAVARACEAAGAVPQRERANLAETLVSLANELDALALDIARRGGATRRQRAAGAYGDGA